MYTPFFLCYLLCMNFIVSGKLLIILFHRTESVEEARFLFKFARGNIKPFAFVHVAAAQLEMKHSK